MGAKDSHHNPKVSLYSVIEKRTMNWFSDIGIFQRSRGRFEKSQVSELVASIEKACSVLRVTRQRIREA